MELNIFSFFSGAGFLDLGFENELYNIVFVNEFNESFLEVYKFSRKKMKLKQPQYGYYCGDINDLLKGIKKQNFSEKVDKKRREWNKKLFYFF